jgi:uncharacterized RDD family membrane protein YckC
MSPTENVTGKRILAALIDMVILAFTFAVVVVIFHQEETVKHDHYAITTYKIDFTGWPFVLYLAGVLAYYVGTEATMFATPGKLALDLRIASADSSPLSFGRIVLRNVLRIVDGLPFLYLVGIITIAASKRDQRVGDMAAQTIVIRACAETSSDAIGSSPDVPG